ncbi:hypothetical protein KJ636_02090 [Patescibacteria group bacterium]|nr:hypothetical protein [Patescibacteria group bacterium]MBU4480786.1 hypothetical protein [Patescibacteria group bacterium]
MEQQNPEKINPRVKDLAAEVKEIAEEFFEKMGFEVAIEVFPPEEQTISIKLEAPEAKILIGERGQTLFELQHLLKAILKRKIAAKGEPEKENFYLDLDINDYKKNKVAYLKELARSVAEDVILTQKERELPPMSPAERRLIHLELAGRRDVITQSVGQGPERRITIRLTP